MPIKKAVGVGADFDRISLFVTWRQTMPRVKGNCEICGNVIGPVETSAVPITGWASERIGGGANQILDKKVIPDRIAHALCVRERAKRTQRGVGSDQMTF